MNEPALTHAFQNIAQDAIGEAILAACKVVPDGLLCFMPSYSLLDRLSQRWQVGTCNTQSMEQADIVKKAI